MVVFRDVHHLHDGLNGYSAVGVERDGGLRLAGETLLQVRFQLLDRNWDGFYVVLEVGRYAYGGNCFSWGLAIASREEELERIRCDHCRGNHKEYEQQEDQVRHRRHRRRGFNPYMAFEFHRYLSFLLYGFIQ